MNIDALRLQNTIGLPIEKKDTKPETNSKIFEEFYKAALGIYEDTNNLQLEAEKLQVDFAAGKTDDYLGMIIAQNKASTALQFTVQVTNKVVDSYKEIMRLQI